MYIILYAIIVPAIILLTATLWTIIDFWLHPIRDPRVLPWPARRCLYEGLVVLLVWLVTCVVYWQAFRWRFVYNSVGAGLGWWMMTLYLSTALRDLAIRRAEQRGRQRD